MASAYQPLNVASAYESVCTRFLAVPGLLIATALVIALLLGDIYGHTFPGHFYNFVVANRSSTAFIVQILSHLLGALYVLALTSLINFRTRLTLTRQPVSLSRLAWWNLLCNRQLDSNLPFQYGILLVVWWGESEMLPVRTASEPKLTRLSFVDRSISTMGRSNYSCSDVNDAKLQHCYLKVYT